MQPVCDFISGNVQNGDRNSLCKELLTPTTDEMKTRFEDLRKTIRGKRSGHSTIPCGKGGNVGFKCPSKYDTHSC